LKKQGLKYFGFLKKYYPILWKIESNCGRWVSTGSGSCLLAFAGFDGETGYPNPWTAASSPWLIQTFTSESAWTFERDGTGSLTGQHRAITLPYTFPDAAPLNKPSVGAYSVSFDFHYTMIDTGVISITADEGTYAIEWSYGPNDGKTFILNGFSIAGPITNDGKTIMLNGGVPEVMTFVESLPPGYLSEKTSQNICNGSHVLIRQNDNPHGHH
jgi:hypothetical protein